MAGLQHKKNIHEYALQNVLISYDKIKYNILEMIGMLKMFFFLQIFQQYIDIIKTNENFIYYKDE